MKRTIVAMVALAASVMFADAQSAKEPYEPGLGEFMTATQIRHAKLWFAGRQKSWDLAAYEIDEIKEGLEEARRLYPTFDSIPVAEMMKTIIDPRIAELEKAIGAKIFIVIEQLPLDLWLVRSGRERGNGKCE